MPAISQVPEKLMILPNQENLYPLQKSGQNIFAAIKPPN